jgi:hypothetical protein
MATFSSTFSSVFGGGGGSPPEDTLAGTFDGITWPLIRVYAAFGASFTPAADTLRLGVGPGLGTGKLGGGIGWVDITADVQTIRRDLGRDSDVDAARVGNCVLTIDNRSGDYDPSNLAGPFTSGGVSLVEVGTPVQVLAEFPLGTVFPRFYGEIADIAPDDGYDPQVTFTCADGLEKLGRARLAETPFTPSFDGDQSGERIGHLADAAAWPSSLRAIDTGYATLGPTTLGASALELMRKVEATEVGLLFVDGAGRLVFYDRHRTETATRSTTVQAAFTDTGGATDVEMTGLQRAKSRERVVNDWHITREAGYIEIDIDGNPTGTDNPTEQVATDEPSRDAFGLLSGGQGLGPLLRFDEEALAMAQGLLPRYPTPQVRIREVAVDAITQGRWAQLLPLTLLDRIAVSRDYGPVTVSGELLVQAMAEEIRNDEANAGWSFTFSTTNPIPAAELWVLGTAQLGVDGLGW